MAQEVEGKVAKKVTWPQWIAGTGVTLLLLQMGSMAGWTSPYVAQLTMFGEPFKVTSDEASWIVSLMNLGRFFGAIFGSLCVNYFGSKTTLFISGIPVSLCWIFTMIANQVIWLYLARFLGGMCLGMCYSSFSLYLGEIADPSIRGALVSLGMTGTSIGNLMICIMGPYLPMNISAIVCLSLCVLLMALFLWLPESPYHLIRKNANEKAKASIYFYHRSCDIDAEFISLKKFVESSDAQSFCKILSEFKIPQIRKALILTMALFMYSQMCGLNNILFYMETILRQAKVTSIEPSLVVIIVMACGIPASCLSMFLIDRCGRKFLMIGSCAMASFSLFGLGITFELLDLGFNPLKLDWLPISSVILFQVAVFVGILSVPTAILGEIFPPNVKCVAACIGSITAGVFSFISTASYQPLLNVMEQQFVMLLYGLLLISAVPFVLLFVPETKGKSLQEIQDDLMKRR